MREFLSYDFDIKEISGAYYVAPDMGTRLHQNRIWHGIALNLGSKKMYAFEGGKCIAVEQNEFVYMPKGSSYAVDSAQSGNCYAVNFELYSEQSFAPFSFKAKNPSLYIQKFKALVGAWTKKSATLQMECKALLYDILALMEGEYYGKYLTASTKGLIAPAVEYIHKHYTDSELAISTLADICNISQDYLRKLFREAYNTSPLKYINQLRITHAEELITSGMYTVSESAQLSGYTDLCYFSREFKKHYGVSPKNYLMQYR